MIHRLPFHLFVKSCLLTLLLVVQGSVSAQYTNGIYAEFNTSMGSFTCRLDQVVAPKAVANFIGLATGERAWLDVSSGLVKTNPFYNGTTFHRVITGFMNQGGSRNGEGTDGPGYQLLDEFHASARHDGFGILSSANSGPDSNGSQFFITVSPQPHLNDVYTVFGKLHGGSNVVYAINRVPTAGANKPVTDVVLQTVVIRRIGVEAQAFDIHAQGLPVVTNLNLEIAKASTNLSLIFGNRLDVENRFFSSTNLQNWSAFAQGFEIREPLTSALQINPVSERRFFRAARIQYPSTLYAPRNGSRLITLNFSNGAGVAIALNGGSAGIYESNFAGTGSVVYVWKQDPYRARLMPLVLSGHAFPFELHLDYDSATNGTFKGTRYLSYPTVPVETVSGTFISTQ